jgi:hypothetical protein
MFVSIMELASMVAMDNFFTSLLSWKTSCSFAMALISLPTLSATESSSEGASPPTSYPFE